MNQRTSNIIAAAAAAAALVGTIIIYAYASTFNDGCRRCAVPPSHQVRP